MTQRTKKPEPIWVKWNSENQRVSVAASHSASLRKTDGLQKEQVPVSIDNWLGLTKSLQPTANKGSSRQETTCTRAQGPTVMPATSLLLPNCKQLLMWPSLTQNHTWNGILGNVVPATQMTRCTSSAASSSNVS